MSVSFAGLYYLISNAVDRAVQISEEIRSGDVPLDVGAITELVSKQATGSEAQLINLATAAVVMCWLVGIVDSYKVGRARDRETGSENTFR